MRPVGRPTLTVSSTTPTIQNPPLLGAAKRAVAEAQHPQARLCSRSASANSFVVGINSDRRRHWRYRPSIERDGGRRDRDCRARCDSYCRARCNSNDATGSNPNGTANV
jgi:hypothetical protein